MQPVRPATRLTAEDAGLMLLAAASGTLDALGYLRLGPALISAMTGNSALLGLAIGQHRFAAASHAGAAFGGFVLGVGGAALVLADAAAGWSPRMTAALSIEVGLLAAFALLWLGTGDARPEAAAYGLILLGSAGMGLQGAAVRRLQIPNVTTTFFTGTLVSIINAAVRATVPPADAHKPPLSTVPQVLAVAAYVAAAACAGLALLHRIDAIALLPAAAVLVVLGTRAVGQAARVRSG